MRHLKSLMRRSCAIVLTLVICLLGLGNASAAITNSGSVTIVKDNFYSLSYSRCHRTLAYGIGGKSADDESVKVIANDDLDESNWYVYTTWKNPNNANYLVVEANIYIDEGCTGFSFATNTHSPMSPSITTGG
ncbi:MAG: hypothetical protein IJ365_00675, partial [Clostridia bacterium]|nr:hypothetical protein [Clostridia bacterium]